MDGCWLEEGWQQWADARRGERRRPVASLPPNPSHQPWVAPSLTDPSPSMYKKKKGKEMNCSSASKFNNCDTLTDKQSRVLQHFVFLFFFFKLISGVLRSCFDHIKLKSAQLTKLLKERSQCSFSAFLCTPTHKHEHKKHTYAVLWASLGYWTFFLQPTENKIVWAFLTCFKIWDYKCC